MTFDADHNLPSVHRFIPLLVSFQMNILLGLINFSRSNVVNRRSIVGRILSLHASTSNIASYKVYTLPKYVTWLIVGGRIVALEFDDVVGGGG